MNVLALLGAAGMGLTWGWILGWLSGSLRPARALLAAIGASALLAVVVAVYASAAGAVVFAGATALAALLHMGQRLQGRVRVL